MVQPTLPPRVQGKVNAVLTLTLSRCQLKVTSKASAPIRVHLNWWGKDEPDQVTLPKDPAKSISIDYDVVTTAKHFRGYLKDMEKLLLEFEGQGTYAVLENLEQIVDEGVVFKALDVFNDEGNVLGSVHCQVKFMDLGSTHNKMVSFHHEKYNTTNDSVFTEVARSADDVEGLRRILLRSRSRLESNTASLANSRRNTTETTFTNNNNSNMRMRIAVNNNDSTTTTAFNDTATAASNYTASSANDSTIRNEGGLLPTWNINTDRLHHLCVVTQLIIDVKKVTLSREALENAYHVNKAKPKVVLSSKSKACLSTPNQPTSFFVSYQMPPSKDAVNLCSKKLAKNATTLSFNNSMNCYPVKFKPEVLDLWWTNDLKFKLFSRSLNQRVPTAIGEAKLGLKHLLMRDFKEELRLPIYINPRFAHEAKLQSEIVGDIHIRFTLSKGDDKSYHRTHEGNCRERPTRDTDTTTARTTTTTTATSTNTSATGSSKRTSSEGTSSSDEKEPQAFVLLKLASGRNFPEDSANIFLKSRLLSAEDIVETHVAWNSVDPTFNVTHYVPIKLDGEFLSRTKENFLVVEAWNMRTDLDKKLLGIAMISLQQFYLTFKEESRKKLALSVDMPVIGAHDWFPVTSMATGEVMGEVKVTLAVGTLTQIRTLLGMKDEMIPISGGEQTKCPSEHTYDTVRSRSRSPSPCPPPRTPPEESLPSTPPPLPCPTPTSFTAKVRIDQAKGLPKIYDPLKNRKVEPSTFVTFTNSSGKNSTVVTNLYSDSSNPHWNFEAKAELSLEILTDPRRNFILKLWHHTRRGENSDLDLDTDHVIGFVAIDLSPLVTGFPSVTGWYNVMDFVGRCRGQVNVSVWPLEDLKRLRLEVRRESVASSTAQQRPDTVMSYNVSAKYDCFPSHIVQHSEQLIRAASGRSSGSSRSTPTLLSSGSSDISVQGPATHSFLQKKISAMDVHTDKLRRKLEGNFDNNASFVRPRPKTLPTSANNTNFGHVSVDETSPSFEDLQRDLAEKLQVLQSATLNLVRPETTESDFEPEMANLISEGNDSERNTTVEIRPETLEDLNSIDWNNVALGVENAEAAAKSRQGPEGEEEARRSRMKKKND